MSLVDLLPSDVLTCVMLHVVTPLVATLPRSRVQVRIESLADCCFTLVSVIRTSTSFRDAVNRRIWNALVRLNEPPVHLDWNVTYAHRVADAEFMHAHFEGRRIAATSGGPDGHAEKARAGDGVADGGKPCRWQSPV